ncbi:hypothetical protein B5E41_30185, partial [Rhizobium esperanzae]
EGDNDQFQAHFTAERDRWQSFVHAWQHEGKSADEIFDGFMSVFADIEDRRQRRFWSVNCTRLVLVARAKDEGRSSEEGI